MNKLETKADRHIRKGELKQKQAKSTNDKLEYVAGKSEEMLGRFQKQTSGIREAVKKSAAGRCD